jgi:hypothetical protein
MNSMASSHRMRDISHLHSYLEHQETKASPSIANLQACIAFDLDGSVLCCTEDNPLLLDAEDFGDSCDMSLLEYSTSSMVEYICGRIFVRSDVTEQRL